MHSKHLKQLCLITVLLLGSTLLSVFLILLSLDRNELIAHIIRLTNKPYLLNLLSNKILTPQKFTILRYGLQVSIILDCITIALLYRFRNGVLSLLNFIFSTIKNCFGAISLAHNTRKENILLLIILAIVFLKGLYYILSFDLQYDEMWSYNYFTSRPVYLIFFSYNNYPIYELSTHLFKWLPFSMKVNLRLPPFLMGIFCIFVLFGCTKKITSHFLTALASVVLFACMPVSVFYMLYARGVMFELFFAVTAFFSLVFLVKTQQKKKYLFLYVASNVLGAYSMPTHLYFWAVFSLVSFLYFILYQKSVIKSILLSNFLILALIVLCYLPVFFGSGLSFVFGALTDTSQSTNLFANTIAYTKGINNFFTGNVYGLVILSFMSFVFLFLYKTADYKYLFTLLLVNLFIFLPSIIYLFQRVFIPERALAFIGLVIPFLGCTLFYFTKNSLKQYQQYCILAIVFIAGCAISHRHEYLNWSVQKDKDAIKLSTLFLKNKIETCYDNSPTSEFYYFYPALEYYFSQQKKTINFNMAEPNSQRYKPLLSTDNFDCIIDSIYANEEPRRVKYKKIFTDNAYGFKVWRLK